MRHQRGLQYLIHRDMDLSAKCKDLQNKLRRNNIRISKGSEGKDMVRFVKQLLKNDSDVPQCSNKRYDYRASMEPETGLLPR